MAPRRLWIISLTLLSSTEILLHVKSATNIKRINMPEFGTLVKSDVSCFILTKVNQRFTRKNDSQDTRVMIGYFLRFMISGQATQCRDTVVTVSKTDKTMWHRK